MTNGTVRWFNPRKGFGFIVGANGAEVFVHHSQIVNADDVVLHEGDEVAYEVVQGEKGPKAAKVVRAAALDAAVR